MNIKNINKKGKYGSLKVCILESGQIELTAKLDRKGKSLTEFEKQKEYVQKNKIYPELIYYRFNQHRADIGLIEYLINAIDKGVYLNALADILDNIPKLEPDEEYCFIWDGWKQHFKGSEYAEINGVKHSPEQAYMIGEAAAIFCKLLGL